MSPGVEVGPYCRKCGHLAAWHGMTLCVMRAGAADVRRDCDCDGYDPAALDTPTTAEETP